MSDARTEPPSTATQNPPADPAIALKAPAPVSPQEAHIMWLDRQEAYLSWAGLVIAFVLSLAFLLVSAGLIARNHDAAGTTLGSVDLVALVAVFVTRSRSDGKEA